ncbi:MAG: PUR family DNA/RNA-binding protein [Bacteroidales bacterium]|nr:PUR family DNA/RNA-binding protein [Bacteroidales bacterium]
MEELDKKEQGQVREEIFSRTVRAGKRTYFFDVKATRSEEHYLTITESKRRFNNDSGKFFYEKHKLFLYKEDFEKFAVGLNAAMEFIQTGNEPEKPEEVQKKEKPVVEEDPHTKVEFEDLGADATEPIAEDKPTEEETKE